MFLRQDHRAVLGILDTCAGEDTYRLGEIGIPTGATCGSKDKTTPPHHSQRLAAAIPNAQIVSVHGGHLLNWEAPDLNWEAPDTLIQAV